MMVRLALRRTLLATITAAAAALLYVAHERLQPVLPKLTYLSGWSLLALMLVLTAYNGRKKLPFLPLISSNAWLQLHVWLGLFTGFLGLLHAKGRWPAGYFERSLLALFGAVMLSGIVGWWLSRSLPRRMTSTGVDVPFEQLPILRRGLRLEAEALVLASIGPAQATTIADFYAGRLAPFFAAPANLADHLRGSRRPVGRLLTQIADLKRFVRPDDVKVVDTLADLVRRKDTLDFHRAMHLVLKGWLFVHIPLTYALLVFTAAHVLLVYSFSGGAR